MGDNMSNRCFSKKLDSRSLICLIGLAVCLVMQISSNACKSEAADKMKIGIFSLEPHVMEKTPSGAAIDFFEKYIKPELSVDIEWQHAGLARIIRNIEVGDYDAGLFFSKTSDREEIAFYPKYPFYETKPCLMVMKNNPLQTLKSVDDILKYRIGYVLNGVRTPFMQDERIIFDMMSGEDIRRRSLMKLEAGRIDAFYQPVCSSCLYVAGQINMIRDIRPVYLPDRSNMVYTIFSKKSPLGKIFAEKYNNAIEKIMGEDHSDNSKIYEKYDEILEKYIK
jgi:ABC-type amino acid transport substrate-binding protein